MIALQNEWMHIQCAENGAELTSLQHAQSGLEYIWQADPAVWPRYTPVLFPIVGKLKSNKYLYEGQAYEIGRHGFARDRKFTLESQTDDRLVFLLKSDAESLKIYPFQFELRIGYQLKGQKLVTSYEVKNTDTKAMDFSIGGHPAFRCPLHPNEKRSDYWLAFNEDEPLEAHLLESDLFSGEKEVVASGHRLTITDELFDRDALVFKNLKSTRVSLNGPRGKVLTFHYQGFPYLGIWSKDRHSPFVCIEPWFGLADSATHDQDFTRKEGIQTLGPGGRFYCDYAVEIH